ncbi:MAG: MurR/RpiR family transcriptional regulator [Eubacteriales bacterium]|nr:MurR/RpiR family transcriptional regulator [Eubacteriales bacterium]
MREDAVRERIQERYGALSASEKKIADYLMENLEKAVNYNVSEMANASGTSDATIVRFCKHLGYSGYYQLRINLSRELGRNEYHQEEEADKNTASGILLNYAKNIQYMAKYLNDEDMKTCAKLIENCHYVHLVAEGNTTTLTQYMGFRLGRLGVRCTYHALPEYYLNDIMMAQEDDIVFAISQSGSSKKVLRAVELANRQKIRTIGIVGYRYSPLSKLVDYLLLALVEDQRFDYSKNYAHLYEMAVVDTLLEQITNDVRRQKRDLEGGEMLMSDSKL